MKDCFPEKSGPAVVPPRNNDFLIIHYNKQIKTNQFRSDSSYFKDLSYSNFDHNEKIFYENEQNFTDRFTPDHNLPGQKYFGARNKKNVRRKTASA
jgi:hypothetical protein